MAHRQTKKNAQAETSPTPKRNDKLVDAWSLVHFATGVLLGWLLPFYIAAAIMIAWEPLEIFVLSPVLARYNIVFGYETLINSLSDIVVDVLGIAAGIYIARLL